MKIPITVVKTQTSFIRVTGENPDLGCRPTNPYLLRNSDYIFRNNFAENWT